VPRRWSLSPFPEGTLERFAWSHTVVRRRPSQPTRRRLARKQGLYRLPKEATHPRGEHPDPGSTCSPTQRRWQASASTSAARVPYGTQATVPNHHRGTKCHGDPSATSPRRATHRSSTGDRLPEATAAGSRPLSKQATGGSAARRCRFAASLSPVPITRHGRSAAHPAHNAERARRVSSPVSTAGAVEASVTHTLLADCAHRG